MVSYFRTWVLGRADTDKRAREMVAAIAKYGLPWMRATAPLPALCRFLIKSRTLHYHEEYYRRPVALLVAGDRAGAAAWLGRLLAKVGTRSDEAAEEFRRFAAALRLRLAEVS